MARGASHGDRRTYDRRAGRSAVRAVRAGPDAQGRAVQTERHSGEAASQPRINRAVTAVSGVGRSALSSFRLVERFLCDVPRERPSTEMNTYLEFDLGYLKHYGPP